MSAWFQGVAMAVLADDETVMAVWSDVLPRPKQPLKIKDGIAGFGWQLLSR